MVGAAADDYRLISDLGIGAAGEQTLLSPDGTKIALPGQLVILANGQRGQLPQGADETVTPAAWSPRGDQLAVIAYTTRRSQTDDIVEWDKVSRAALRLIKVDTGQQVTITDLDPGNVVDGFTVAFAPDGRTLAYQSGNAVTVADLTGAVRSQFRVPADTRLGGKGAWTPDGRRIALVSQRACCTGEAYPSRWRLRLVDPATGTESGPPAAPEQPGLVAMRLLGWTPSGEPVVARYHPDDDASTVDFGTNAGTISGSGIGITSFDWVRKVDVAALRPAAPPRVLIATYADQTQSIDVADHVLASGATRAGHPPTGLGPHTKIMIGALSTWLLAIVGGLAWLLYMARRPPRTQ